MKSVARLDAFAVLCACALLIGCGGGGSTTTPAGTQTAIPAPSPSASSAPAAQATLVPIASSTPYLLENELVVPAPSSTAAGASSVSVSLPFAGNVGSILGLPADGAQIPAGTIVDAVVTNQDPSDAVGISARERPASLRSAQSVGPLFLIAYFGLAFTQTIVLNSYPSFQITFPPGSLPPGAAYYLALYDTSNPSAGWIFPWEGPAAITNGNILLFTGLAQPFTFKAGVRYYFGLYVVSARATPSPRPSQPPPTPTPSPGASATPGPLSVQPALLAFDAPGQTATLAVSKTNFHGTFSATSSNAAIASVASSGASSFLVTAGTTAGSTSIAVSDSSGGRVTVPLTVTITEGAISSHARR